MARLRGHAPLIFGGAILGLKGGGTDVPWVAGTHAGRDVIAALLTRGTTWKFGITCTTSDVTEFNNPTDPDWDKTTFAIPLGDYEVTTPPGTPQLRNMLTGEISGFGSEKDFAGRPVILHPQPAATGEIIGTVRTQSAGSDIILPQGFGVSAEIGYADPDGEPFLRRNGDAMALRSPARIQVGGCTAWTSLATAAASPGVGDAVLVGEWQIRTPSWPEPDDWHSLTAPLYGRFTDTVDVNSTHVVTYSISVIMELTESLRYGHNSNNPSGSSTENAIWNADGTMALLPGSPRVSL